MRNKIFVLLHAFPIVASAGLAVTIPTRFETDRVYVELTTASGVRLELYTDSGGGNLVISRGAAARLGLEVSRSGDPEVQAELGPDSGIATSPALAPGLPALPKIAFVVPKAVQIPAWPEQGDGFLGAPWFAGGIWTWDYPGRRLIRQPDEAMVEAGEHVVPIAFKVDPDGKRPTSFARLSIRVDGKQLPMLLDTGAETLLTPDALAEIGDGGLAMRAASMVAASIFDDWHHSHPDWRYIPNGQAETHASMIEIPSVEVAGFATGPVWFTRRSDANFHDFMTPMMDARVEGAVGGNVFRFFEMTVDYPAARAKFRCVVDCRVATTIPADNTE